MGIPDDRCALLASVQQGCISLDQAVACGLSHDATFRRARTGRWRRLLPGVYAIEGAPSTWDQALTAALLWGGEGAAISAASAAALWRFPDFGPGPVEISNAGTKRRQRGVLVHRVALDRRDVTVLDARPVTTPARTLLDVASRLSPSAFDVAFHHCLHAGIADLQELSGFAERHAGRAGTRLLRQALDAYSSGGRAAASPLEVRLARLLDCSNLPPPRRQHEVRVAGRRRYLDFAWPAARVAVEADGYRWHSSRSAWESDRARLRDLRAAGWTVISVTHDDVKSRRIEVVAEIAGALAR